MLDHVTIAVAEFERAKAFYQKALRPLGLSVLMEGAPNPSGSGAYAGFGEDGKPFFWIAGSAKPKGGTHVAFLAHTRKEVDGFHKAAIDAGGTDNGAPGLRSDYHPNYYGAFVLDPDGNNIEAVCHRPVWRR